MVTHHTSYISSQFTTILELLRIRFHPPTGFLSKAPPFSPLRSQGATSPTSPTSSGGNTAADSLSSGVRAPTARLRGLQKLELWRRGRPGSRKGIKVSTWRWNMVELAER